MRFWHHHLLVIFSYALVTLVMTWPVPASLTHAVAGRGGDPWQTLWRFEQESNKLSAAFADQKLGGFIYQEFLGGGPPRLINVAAWPWLPLHLLLGEPLAYNIVWLLSFILSGYIMYCLLSWLIQSESRAAPPRQLIYLAAWTGGLYYMWLPFHVAHSQGHFGAMQTQWIPLIVWLLLRWLKRPTFTSSLLVTAALILQAWSEHHYIFWSAIVVVFLLVWQRQRLLAAMRMPQGKIYLVSMATLLIVGVVLPYLPTIREAGQGQNTLALGIDQTIRFSADPFSYVVPASFHSLWGDLSAQLFTDDFTGNVTEATHYLGLLPLLLLFFFHQRLPQDQKKWWTIIAISFFVISLGPRLHILGYVTTIPLPYALVDSWPVFSAIRTVNRSGVMVGLATSVLLGWLLVTQAKRTWSYVLISGLILLEFVWLPAPTQSTELPNVYQLIKERPGLALIELPAATNYTAASRALYASTIHNKEVVANIALERTFRADVLEENVSLPALRQLLYVKTAALDKNRAEFLGQDLSETMREVMHHLDALTILIHTDSLSAPQTASIRAFLETRLLLQPHTFPNILLYEVPPLASDVDGVYAERGTGWEYEYNVDTTETTAVIAQHATVRFVNLNPTPQRIEIQGRVVEGVDTVSISQSDIPLQTLAATPGEVLTMEIVVAPGEQHFSLTTSGPLTLSNPSFKVAPAQAL
ncbi:MAG: hypothetical protein WD972_02000 [Candidatus Andersenbacteria bacterium]